MQFTLFFLIQRNNLLGVKLLMLKVCSLRSRHNGMSKKDNDSCTMGGRGQKGGSLGGAASVTSDLDRFMSKFRIYQGNIRGL